MRDFCLRKKAYISFNSHVLFDSLKFLEDIQFKFDHDLLIKKLIKRFPILDNIKLIVGMYNKTKIN